MSGNYVEKRKVSVIIPCYNQGKYVEEAINSVLAQTYKDIEIVCINDGSEDNSGDILNLYAQKYNNIVYLNNNINRGVIYSRNLGILSCTGDYILPLDSDDTIEPEYIEKAVRILDEKSKVGIVYCKSREFGEKAKSSKLKKFDKSDILYENLFLIPHYLENPIL